ncbi:hypothetical protein J6590_023320 [Homalodisca vitripennis]|nr:hypothetical protein J6590_023320 [Homalodisca vitripennis]
MYPRVSDQLPWTHVSWLDRLIVEWKPATVSYTPLQVCVGMFLPAWASCKSISCRAIAATRPIFRNIVEHSALEYTIPELWPTPRGKQRSTFTDMIR